MDALVQVRQHASFPNMVYLTINYESHEDDDDDDDAEEEPITESTDFIYLQVDKHAMSVRFEFVISKDAKADADIEVQKSDEEVSAPKGMLQFDVDLIEENTCKLYFECLEVTENAKGELVFKKLAPSLKPMDLHSFKFIAGTILAENISLSGSHHYIFCVASSFADINTKAHRHLCDLFVHNVSSLSTTSKHSRHDHIIAMKNMLELCDAVLVVSPNKEQDQDLCLCAEDDDNTSTTAITGPEDIPVSKFILSMHSSVFRTMFSSGMKESVENKVYIEGFRVSIVQTMIQFMYDNIFVSKGGWEKFLSLYTLADLYAVDNLREAIVNYLVANIMISSWTALWKFAKANNIDKLKKEILRFVEANINEILACTEEAGHGEADAEMSAEATQLKRTMQEIMACEVFEEIGPDLLLFIAKLHYLQST